jgi:hypothetical protein
MRTEGYDIIVLGLKRNILSKFRRLPVSIAAESSKDPKDPFMFVNTKRDLASKVISDSVSWIRVVYLFRLHL